MGRRDEREAIQDTWMVMREPKDLTGNRASRRARVAEARRSVRAAESSEARLPQRAPRDSAAPTEGT